MLTSLEVKPAAFQGADAVVIDAPIAVVWESISDSKALERWGPPVREVQVFDNPEGLGSRRLVIAEMTPSGGAITRAESLGVRNKRTARFMERRIEHAEGVRIAYRIDEDNMGLSRMLSEVGFSMEVTSIDQRTTQLVWAFQHNTKGLLAALMNPLVIRPQQRRNRLAALASLKVYAEEVARRSEGPKDDL